MCFVKSCRAGRVRRTGGGGLFRFGLLVVGDERLGGLVAGVVAPVGLHEHGVDLFEIDGQNRQLKNPVV